MLARLLKQIFGARASRGASHAGLTAVVQLQQSGQWTEAESACRAILGRDPGNPAALHLLGSTLLAQNRHREACEILIHVVEREPGSAEAHYNLACAYKDLAEAERAVDHFREALRLRPDLLAAYVGAGSALMQAGRLEEAEASYRAAVSRKTDFAEAQYNLGNLLRLVGRHAEAEQSYRAALAANPGFGMAQATLLFTLNCNACDPAPIDAEHRSWARQHADPLTAAAAPHVRTRDADRRLRIGYVSPDLCSHPVGRFMDNVLANRDESRFELWCYYSHVIRDEVSTRLRSLADRWIECAHLSDTELAARIRDDGIDILVDLAGHTRDNRLLAFARKPAPVQATYLGYPTTTGMAAIDYRITDNHVDPEGEEPHGVERAIRLPHTYFSFRPPYVDATVGPLPSTMRGHVTFGSFNNLVKLSDATLDLWSRVLAAVPDAQLVLKAKDLSEPGVRMAVEQRFARAGVARHRLALHGWEDTGEAHLAFYNGVDIGLDTYPYNGATTTCESLWMGVPVVTLKGRTHASRMAASILAAAGMPELIATNADEYVRICTQLAADRARVARLRAALRDKLRSSPLMDPPAFARALEDAYRRMWLAYCAR